jgi:hypothetical protein
VLNLQQLVNNSMVVTALRAFLWERFCLVSLVVCLLFCLSGCSKNVYQKPTLVGDSEIGVGPVEKELPTKNVWLYGTLNIPLDQPMPIILYTDEPRKYLLGNLCSREYMLQNGFLYVSVEDFPNRDVSDFKLWRANKRSEWKIFWRLGPGWKRKLNNQLEQCKNSSGDFVG